MSKTTPHAFAAAVLALATSAAAGECMAVGRDGLTARLVNPAGRVTGEIDATGCDIGIYYERATGSLEAAELYGARVAGVVVAEGATVGIEGVVIHGLGVDATGVLVHEGTAAVAASRIEVRSGHGVLAVGASARAIAIDSEVATPELRSGATVDLDAVAAGLVAPFGAEDGAALAVRQTRSSGSLRVATPAEMAAAGATTADLLDALAAR